jgi:hypothetical protein
MVTVKNFWSTKQFHLNYLNLPQAWQKLRDEALVPDITFGKPTIVIAINDQGVETVQNDSNETIPNHPDFIGKLTNGNPKFQLFYDFRNHIFSVTKLESGDKNDHGMATTSVVASQPDASSYVKGIYEGIVGIAPNCQIISTKTNKYSDSDSSQGELLWLAGIDPKKLRDNNSTKPFKALPSQGADIISLSFQFLFDEIECKTTIGLLTSIGRNGRGTLCFLSAGNANQVVDSFSGENQIILKSDKLIGIAATMIQFGGTEIKSINSNFSNSQYKGIDFCIPDVIYDVNGDPSSPFVASFKGDGRVIGNLNNPFKLEITSINSVGDEIIVAELPTVFKTNSINHPINYTSMSVVVGDKADLSAENRYKVLEEDNIISSVVTGLNKIILQTPLQDKNNKKSITILNITSNPSIITKLTSDIPAGTTNVVNVFNSYGFAAGQKVTIGQEGRTNIYEAIIAPAGTTLTTITLNGGNIPVKFKKGDVITVQRIAISASGLTLTLSDTFGLDFAEILVIGDPTTGNVYRKINSVNHSAKTVTLSGSALPTITYPTPVSGHRGVAATTSASPVKKLTVNDARGLIEEMGSLIRLPFDSDVIARKITNIDLTPVSELKFDEYITSNVVPVLPSIGINTPLIVSDRSYKDDFSGTSFSTPVAAGIAALVLSAKPTLNWVELKYILRKTAVKLNYSNSDPIGTWVSNRLSPGTKPVVPDVNVYSRWYGYGRLDAFAAVQEALSYNPATRDLRIRDILSDDGTPNPSSTSINSPDIWHRVNTPISEGPSAYPGGNANYAANFNLFDKDQPIVLGADSYLYARINNAGSIGSPTTEKNLDAWVRFYVATTDQPPSASLFKFPDNWYGNDDVSILKTSGTHIQFIDEIKIDENTLDPGNVGSLIDTNIVIKNVKWTSAQKPHAQNRLDTYILILVSPFDGGTADSFVHNNNNLSYKKVSFNSIGYNDGTGTKDLQNTIPVDTDGSPETLPFSIDLSNTQIAFANNIEIQATITYRNSTPSETVTFKYNGSIWAFTVAPSTGWISLNAPVLSGSTSGGIQELTSFGGSVSVDNTVLNIAFVSKQSDNTTAVILNRSFSLNIIFNFPETADGVAAENKTAIFTFTDFDQLPVQSGTNNYGPVSAALTTEYRTWSAFTGIQSGTILKAYAVTNGEFFIQEVTGNPNVVNLILKPDTQPDNKIGHVRYFVYRGLSRSSFLQPSGEVLLNGSGLSDLLTRMWQVRTSLDTESTIPDVIKRSDLGLDETGTATPTPGTTLVQDIFDTYVFQKLSPGMHIGDFYTAGDYGFEIIVDGPNYNPILNDLKVLDHKVVIAYVAGQPTFANGNEEDIKTKLDREKILSFIDPVAYFGLLAYGKIELKKSSGNTTISSDAAQINTEILIKFATKTKIYVDIRNDLNNSLNFYGSYSDNSISTKVAKLLFKDTSNVYINKEYHTSGWPIMILNTSDFNSNTSDFIKAEFQLPTGDNNLPSLFLSGASFYSDGLNYKDIFKVLTSTSGYSDKIEISVGNISSSSTVLPFAIKMAYTRRYDVDNLQSIPSILTRPWKDDYIDNLLVINEVEIVPVVGDTTFQNTVKWETKNDLRYIGWTSLKGFDFTIKSGLAKDKFGVVFFAFLSGASESNNVTNSAKTNSELNLSRNAKKNLSFYLANNEDLNYLKLYKRVVPTSSGNIDMIQVSSVTNSISVDILEKSGDNLFSVAISSSDYTSLVGGLNNYLVNSTMYCVLFNHQLNNDLNDFVYFEAELGVQYTSYTTSGYNIIRENKGIKLYSIDGKNYFSIAYTNNLKILIPQLIA